jgi:hypothetical protein
VDPGVVTDPLVFLLGGQSNMVREGAFITRSVGAGESIAGTLRFPVTTNPDGTLTVPCGPGFAFARGVAQATGRPVVLVGGAKGGSSIAEWQRGTPLYAETLAATLATNGQLAALLFAQGEADARDDGQVPDARPDDWHLYFAGLVCALRVDLGAPDLPVLLGLLGTTTSPVHGAWGRVRACQAAAAIPGLVKVDPNPVALIDGGVHWTDASYGDQGRRLAAAYLALGAG